jgi:hypothetical protein
LKVETPKKAQDPKKTSSKPPLPEEPYWARKLDRQALIAHGDARLAEVARLTGERDAAKRELSIARADQANAEIERDQALAEMHAAEEGASEVVRITSARLEAADLALDSSQSHARAESHMRRQAENFLYRTIQGIIDRAVTAEGEVAAIKNAESRMLVGLPARYTQEPQA